MSDIPVLYDYWRSSASYRVRIALNLAGISYKSVMVDLVKGDQNRAEHLARNAQGLVPVLEIDGQRFTQSLAIVEYLDETRQLGLLPSDPVQRAKIRALAQAVAVDIHPVCNLRVVAHATKNTKAAGAREAWMQHFIASGLQAVEIMLADFEQRPYAVGPSPSLADICLIPQLYNAHRWKVSLKNMPRLSAIEEACTADPAFRAAYPTEPVPEQTPPAQSAEAR